MKINYFALKIFSAKGGIEQVNKNWLSALRDIASKGKLSYRVFSMYDDNYDERYIEKQLFNGCKSNKVLFALTSIWSSIFADVIVLSHLNLSLFALIAKLVNPKLNIIIQLHGIESWRELSGTQELLLEKSDQILAVSNYTASVIRNRYPKHQHKVIVFHNSLDIFIEDNIDTSNDARAKAREHLHISNNEFVLLTIGRLNSSESYKGYDKTIEALALFEKRNFKYYIVGKYDELEKKRVSNLIEHYKLTNNVILVGFVSYDELINYYRSSDLFIMPSKGEGFGLVFIDAMAHGLRVVGGNIDGSVDAISPFKDSKLINPDDIYELRNAIQSSMMIDWDENKRTLLSRNCIHLFSSEKFHTQVELLFN